MLVVSVPPVSVPPVPPLPLPSGLRAIIFSKTAFTVFASVIINSIGFNVGSISSMSPVHLVKAQPSSATAISLTVVSES